MAAPESTSTQGIGSFHCEQCGYSINLTAADDVPDCPGCGGQSFTRTALFDGPAFLGRPWPRDARSSDGSWLDEVREELAEPGQYIAYHAPGEDRVVAFSLSDDWTRIGRSLAADIRFDDPTVSRRHALVIRRPDGVRVLDDRSLNGVFVNGERVEWGALRDGDEIVVGAHSLRFLDVAPVGRRGARGAGAGLAATA